MYPSPEELAAELLSPFAEIKNAESNIELQLSSI